MKTIRIIALTLVTSLIPLSVFCQESLEPAEEEASEPAQEAEPTSTEAVSSEEAAQAEAISVSSETVNQEESSSESQASKPLTISQQLVTFFEGLNAAVSSESDCQRMSAAITTYCEKHSSWISSLDYATGNVNDETMARIHEMALEFGKKLSSCYEEASIPNLLRQYAGMGSLD